MITFAVCTYNRCENLPKLLAAMTTQKSRYPYEVLVVDNNSKDETKEVVTNVMNNSATPLRYVFESQQGITYARNRAISESLDSEILLFIDDDEIPNEEFVDAAGQRLLEHGDDCVGGKVDVVLPSKEPKWFSEDLYGFLAAVDYGEETFRIVDRSTPIWTANVGYRTEIFKSDPELRFDSRYNRSGNQIGGGSDAAMFWRLLEKDLKISYEPRMVVRHFVEDWRINRRYFVKLHYRGGFRFGQFRATPDQYEGRRLAGIPLYLFTLFFKQSSVASWKLLTNAKGAVRDAMNAAYTLGTINGIRKSDAGID